MIAGTRKLIYITFISLALIVFFMKSAAVSCNLADFTFFNFYDGKKTNDAGNFSGAASDSVVKFCTQSAVTLLKNIQVSSTGEVKVILNRPISFNDELVKLDESQKKEIADSIELEIAKNYTNCMIKLCDSAETALILKDVSGQATDPAIFITPDIAKKMYDRHKVRATLDISFYELNSQSGYSADIRGLALEKRDIVFKYSTECKIRYKLTGCENNEIIWIDEVGGLAENIFYFSLFRKGLPLDLLKECSTFSVLSSGSCANN